MTSRVLTEENVTRIREAVAPKITIDWDPVTNGGSVTFFLADQVTENGVYKGMETHKTLRANAQLGQIQNVIVVPMEEIMGATITTSSGTTPGYVLMVLIKAFFEQLYTDRLNAQDAADALKASEQIPAEL
jgi:hypothetical protein